MRLPTINMLSFWIGAAVATVVWWALSLARPLINQLIAGSQEKRKERQLQASAGVEDTHRKIVYKQTQGMHMAASLFALDEIAQMPRLLAPPPFVEPGAPRQRADIIDKSLPYLPAWPELACIYRAPTLSIPQALSGGRNLIITGQPGIGKTFALAHLASQIVNRAPQAERLHQNIPFLVHVADLGLPLNSVQKPEDLLAPISEYLGEFASVFDKPRIFGFTHYAFQSGRALLLLDGVDELPQAAIPEVAGYLRILLKAYPKTRVITTGSTEYIDGILSLGFIPLALMPWNIDQQNQFLQRWSELWQRYVAMEAWAQTAAEPVDAILLNRWLDGARDNVNLTPLEFTLKIWAAYAGDVRGARPVDAIEAHLHRLLPKNTPIEALYTIGAQASLNGNSIFDSKLAREWTKSFEPAETAPAETATAKTPPPETATEASDESAPEATKETKNPAAKKGSVQAPQTSRPSLIGQLAESGILSAHKERLRFAHPVFMGVLAGRGLSGGNAAEQLLNQPAWCGQTISMRYMAAFGDVSALVNNLLAQEDHLLMRPKLTAARLLRDAPRNVVWRGTVMSALINLLQANDQPLGLRGQAIAAFALSGDPNVSALFRQLLLAPSSELRQLAALGAGMLADVKSVEALAGVLMQPTGADTQAACLALVQIGTAPALETVATILMRGEEQARIAAAEALANHSGEGREALRDGITNQDILLRRAIVYGLARVDEPWAQELLEKTQVEDDQWAVRNVAVEILDARKNPNPRIPRRLTPPSETPWLIEFAGTYGMGVAPGQPATDIFLLALKSDNEEARIAALDYLRYTPSEGVLSGLYPQYFSDDPETREAVYQTLSDIAYGGTVLPSPMQFGIS